MRGFDRWHVLGALAGGLLVGWVAAIWAMREPASPAELRRLSYQPRESISRTGELWFGNFPCETDCSGHIAGYEWARDKKLSRASSCEGHNSGSFSEGCYVYLGVAGFIDDPDF